MWVASGVVIGECNGPSPPLGAFPFGLLLKVYKTHLLGRGFHTLIKGVSFSSPSKVGSHKGERFGLLHNIIVLLFYCFGLENM